jgi:hypothetical protein
MTISLTIHELSFIQSLTLGRSLCPRSPFRVLLPLVRAKWRDLSRVSKTGDSRFES